MATKKVMLVSTGGTIDMKYDSQRKGIFPAASCTKHIAELMPFLAGVCSVETMEFSNIPSSHMTPRRMFKLAQTLDNILSREDIWGAVVTHGTDTLEETAYLLSLVLKTTKPVCLTAAMRSSSAMDFDGYKNILSAVKTVISTEAVGKGVLVVMNEEIHTAREITKTHSARIKAFDSPFWGPLGYVDDDKVVFRRYPLHVQKVQPAQLVEDVYLVKTSAGSNDLFLKYLAEKRVKGIVVEGLGRGNIPPDVLPGIKLVIQYGIPVILTTRVLGGRVLDVYGYEGGTRHLKEMGVILGGEISGHKARIKLMLVLGLTENPEEIVNYFDFP